MKIDPQGAETCTTTNNIDNAHFSPLRINLRANYSENNLKREISDSETRTFDISEVTTSIFRPLFTGPS